MTEPPRIQGPGSPDHSIQKKDRTVGADDFKKYMVEEVKEIDTEAKGKKRKKREEGEEDTDAEKKAVGAALPPPALKPMQSVEETPLQAKGGLTAIPTSKETGAPTTTTFAFNPQEIENYAWEDEAKRTTQQFASSPPPQYPQQEETYPQYREPTRFEGFTAPSVEAQSPQTAPSERNKEKGKEKEPLRPPSQKKPGALPKKIEKSPMEPSKLLAKEGKRKKGGAEEFKTFMEEPKPQAKETAKPPKEKPMVHAPALTTMKKEPAGKIKHKTRGEKPEEEIAGQVSLGGPAAAIGAGAEKQGAGKERKPREEREYPTPLQIAGPLLVEGMPSGVSTTTAPIASVSPYAELHPEILSLFERMIGVMTVMKTAGITETTLVLSEKTFAGTVLSGTSIKISEYRFAAGQLNLEFSGTPQAVALLQQHLPSLTAALSRAGLVVKRTDFIFSRKESPGGRGEEQKEREKER